MYFKKVNLKTLEDNYKKPNNLMHKKIRIVNKLIHKGDSLLDLGVGTGAFIDFIKEKFENIYGIDLDKNSIKICKKKFNLYKYIHIECGNITKISEYFYNFKFDCIIALDVLEHITESDAKIVLVSI